MKINKSGEIEEIIIFSVLLIFLLLLCLSFYFDDSEERKNRYIELTTSERKLTIDEKKELASLEYDLKLKEIECKNVYIPMPMYPYQRCK